VVVVVDRGVIVDDLESYSSVSASFISSEILKL